MTTCRFAVKVLGLATISLALPASSYAQGFPDKPVTVIVGSGPGSAPDTITRIVADGMSQILGQPVVVENRPGAAGNIGASAAAKADADGYTLMMMTAVHSISPSLQTNLNYSFTDDFIPVGMVAEVPLMMVVNNDLGVSDMPGFIERAKESDIFYSTPGVGTLQHLSTEEFARMNDIEMMMIPYKGGGAATQAVISNEVEMFYAGMPPALPQVTAGALTALGVSSQERSPAVPDVPTFIELGYDDYTVDNWHAIYAPDGTPDEVIETLSSALNEVLEREETAEQFLNVGAMPHPNTPDEQKSFGESEFARWARVIKDNGITLEQ
ncbi:Bug family tripartite tricarboxylate transporter substrate binding protein [Halomonas sp. 86]|uniref:Bug family tripartite tricarboxylate transporter substrate binding protein n=1 Tax=unclassified Halomonas TaxID=2609666 RepID=UPI004034A45E